MTNKQIIEDINLIIQAILNLDTDDALKLLQDLREDLEISDLIS